MEHSSLALGLAGLVVGLLVGLTGVGGGTLMTPLLLYLGFAPVDAVGTDLVYAAVTKTSGAYLHSRRHNVEWPLVGWLLLGSLPASLLTLVAWQRLIVPHTVQATTVKVLLGLILIGTGALVLLRLSLRKPVAASPYEPTQPPRKILTILLGALLGILVTLSSAGAGAVGAAALSLLFPRLSASKIIGSDLAHAVPLTLTAGLAHLATGHVHLWAVFWLCLGSIPALAVGSWLAPKVPERILKPVMGTGLALLGLTLV
ncbi:MAG: sulfite exporter TauE/SafE family protein [Spirochaetales bacterium]|nr:sulfite exporter TauE/SafE family protein [Spirochaetales bacterium]